MPVIDLNSHPFHRHPVGNFPEDGAGAHREAGFCTGHGAHVIGGLLPVHDHISRQQAGKHVHLSRSVSLHAFVQIADRQGPGAATVYTLDSPTIDLRLSPPFGATFRRQKGGPACIRRQLFAENPSTGALLLENDLQFRRCGLSGKNLRNKHRLEWRLGIFPQAEQDLFN